MEGFKRGFYTTSKMLKRKPESNLGQSSFPQPLTLTFFLILITQRGTQTSSEKSTCNNPNLIREAKEADEICSSLGDFGVQSFQPDEYGITHQSGVKPTERGQEAKKIQ